MKAIRYLSWSLRAVLFLLLLLFALKNTELVPLRFFFFEVWQVPLVLLLLIFFAFGAALGVLACMTRLLRERREIIALKKDVRRLAALRGEAGAENSPVLPPAPGA